MLKNLPVRRKIFLGFGVVLLLLAIVSIVSIFSVKRITRNSTFVKNVSFKEAVSLLEIEGILKQLAMNISSSVDAGTIDGLNKATKIKEELDKKWAELETVFAEDKEKLQAINSLKEKANKNFTTGSQLVHANVNQDWGAIGTLAPEYNKSRDELFELILQLKKDGIQKLEDSLVEIVGLSRKTATLTAVIMFIAMLAGVALSYTIGATIVKPLQKLQESTAAIAGGELSEKVDIDSNDEIGALARSFNQMTLSLKEMLTKVNDTFKSLDDISKNLTDISKNISNDSGQTAKSIDTVYKSVEEMNKASQRITSNMEDFAKTTEEMNSWIFEMTGSISELASNADNLATSVSNTTSSIHEMSAAINQISQHVNSLSDLQTSSSSSIMEISSSIKEVEEMTRHSASLADKVRKIAAGEGMSSVAEAVQGIRTVNDAVNKSTISIKQLGSHIGNISKIVNVINTIADQTKLLSLNASILAAQAGEHGKGFNVVAEEISKLSETTIQSTKEIEALISSITNESKNAIQLMIEGSRMAEEGVSLVHKVESVLNEINTAAESSHEIAQQISKSMVEQAKSGNLIIESMQDVTQMCESINKSTSEQKDGAALVVKAAEEINDVSIILRKTTDEQLAGSKRIAEGMDNAVVRSKSILGSIQQFSNNNEILAKSMGEIQFAARKNLEATQKMNSAVNILSQKAALLKEELGKFRFDA